MALFAFAPAAAAAAAVVFGCMLQLCFGFVCAFVFVRRVPNGGKRGYGHSFV